jgi:hypothetical protein
MTHTAYRVYQEKNPDPRVGELRHKFPLINVFMKDVFEVWQAPYLFKVIDHEKGILLHENDGLIFTIDKCPYYPRSCPEIMKWKPAHMNTVDF